MGNGSQAPRLIPLFQVVVDIVLQFLMIGLSDLRLRDPTKFSSDVVKHGSWHREAGKYQAERRGRKQGIDINEVLKKKKK